MFESTTQQELRAQMEQHLLMVEEVLGGMDQFVQRLERRIARIEEGLGLEPQGHCTYTSCANVMPSIASL